MTIKLCQDTNIALVAYAAAHVPAYRTLLETCPVDALQIFGIDVTGISASELDGLPDDEALIAIANDIVSGLVAQHNEGRTPSTSPQVSEFICSLQTCEDQDDSSRDEGDIHLLCQTLGPSGFGLAARLAYDEVFYELAKCNPEAALRIIGLDDQLVYGIDGSSLASQEEIRTFLQEKDANATTVGGTGAQVKEFWSTSP